MNAHVCMCLFVCVALRNLLGKLKHLFWLYLVTGGIIRPYSVLQIKYFKNGFDFKFKVQFSQENKM